MTPGRRRLIMALGATALAPLPTVWAQPEIESIGLPDHAQASPPCRPEGPDVLVPAPRTGSTGGMLPPCP
jgi:hypothetical protein